MDKKVTESKSVKNPTKPLPKTKRKTTPEPSAPQTVVSSKVSSGALIVAILASALSLYTLVTLNNNKMMHSSNTESLTLQINQLTGKQTTLNSEINKRLDSVQSSQRKINLNTTSLENKLHTALRQQAYQTDDWLLQKSLYYLQLAQITLHWTNDTESTMSLLKTADKLLAHVNNANLYDTRQLIAHEITALNTLARPDIPGLLSELSAVTTRIATLPLNKQKFELNASPNPTSTADNSWQQALDNSLSSLKQLVVIRYHNQNIKPILSPLQREILYENLRLSIQQAQWAALHNNQTLYDFSLNQTASTIKHYFDDEATSTQQLTKQLQALQGKTVKIDKPDISQSAENLKKAIASLNQAPSNAEKKQ